MFCEHQFLDTPKDDTILWRYSDLSHFLSLLDGHELYFTNRNQSIEDPWEGAIATALTAAIKRASEYVFRDYEKKFGTPTEDLKEVLFGPGAIELRIKALRAVQAHFGINCWHKNRIESVAMWKLYTHGRDGVAIQTTVGRLKKCLSVEPRPVLIADVRYEDHELPEQDGGDTEVSSFFELQFIDKLMPLLMKRRSFAHESEVRLVLIRRDVPNNPELNAFPELSKGETIRVDLNELIERIVASPDYPSWAIASLQERVTAAGLAGRVETSDLLRQPVV
jgi:hypothetical protein